MDRFVVGLLGRRFEDFWDMVLVGVLEGFVYAGLFAG